MKKWVNLVSEHEEKTKLMHQVNQIQHEAMDIKLLETDLLKGGFPREWVKNVLKSVAVGYVRKIAARNSRGFPLNKPNSYNKSERLTKYLVSENNWLRIPKPQGDQGFKKGINV